MWHGYEAVLCNVLLCIWYSSTCCNILYALLFIVLTPLPPFGHIWDVMLTWWKGNIEKKTVTVLCTIIMVHKSTSNFYRSVNCILLEYANSVCNPFKKGDVEDIGKIKKILLQCYMSLQYTWSMLTRHFSNNLSEKKQEFIGYLMVKCAWSYSVSFDALPVCDGRRTSS